MLFSAEGEGAVPALDAFDRFLVQCSGGKDSLASLLYLLDLGIPKERIEVWHQRIDGEGDPWMDWPATEHYVALVAEHLGLPLLMQCRAGGFRGELYREHAVPGSVHFERDGKSYVLPSLHAAENTRRRFPAPTADLRRRWCSSSLKIDVAARAITHDPTLTGTKNQPLRLAVVSGERHEESRSRSRYPEWELHRTDARVRRVWQWRPVVEWQEQDVWEIIRRHGIRPHPAYLLGWSRCSCAGCIFQTPHLWAMTREVMPEFFGRLEAAEQELAFTIDPKLSLSAKADRGTLDRLPPAPERSLYQRWALEPDAMTLANIAWEWPDGWYPAGAFRGTAGGSL